MNILESMKQKRARNALVTRYMKLFTGRRQHYFLSGLRTAEDAYCRYRSVYHHLGRQQYLDHLNGVPGKRLSIDLTTPKVRVLCADIQGCFTPERIFSIYYSLMNAYDTRYRLFRSTNGNLHIYQFFRKPVERISASEAMSSDLHAFSLFTETEADHFQMAVYITLPYYGAFASRESEYPTGMYRESGTLDPLFPAVERCMQSKELNGGRK